MKSRLAVITGLLSAAVLMLATAPAVARADVSVSIGVPGFYVQPAPVYVPAPPVYVQPQTYYYAQPRPIYVRPQPYYIDQQYRQDWRQRRWNRHHRSRQDHDRDGDGVPNRFDRRPDNPYRS
jgi:hypothetical protein